MANIPKTNTTGITQSEGLLQQLFQYLQGLQGGQTPAPQVPMTGLPTQGGLNNMIRSFSAPPMSAAGGGGIDPTTMGRSYGTNLTLGSNPARANINLANQQARTGILGQNANLLGTNLFNNQSMQAMIQSLMGGTSNQLSQLGTMPPSIRGQAQGVAASGTGGGMDLLGLFGI